MFKSTAYPDSEIFCKEQVGIFFGFVLSNLICVYPIFPSSSIIKVRYSTSLVIISKSIDHFPSVNNLAVLFPGFSSGIAVTLPLTFPPV